MKEFCLFGIVTVLFALTFALAGAMAAEVFESQYYGPGFGAVILPGTAIVAFVIACIAWLVLRLGKMPSWFVMPIWILAFSSVVIFLSISGESTVGLYITAFLWIPVTLLVVGIIYICLLLHYRRESRPRRLKRDSK